MNSLNVKRGDTVVVLTGKDKGKKGKVLTANPTNETVTVEGINIVTKHVKPRGAQNPGGMQKVPGNVHVSNVMLVCPSCSKPTRIAHMTEAGERARTCKKCGAAIDKVAKAEAKKPAKKSAAKSDDAATETKKKPARKAKVAEETAAPAAAPEAEKPVKAAKTAKKTEKADDQA